MVFRTRRARRAFHTLKFYQTYLTVYNSSLSPNLPATHSLRVYTGACYVFPPPFVAVASYQLAVALLLVAMPLRVPQLPVSNDYAAIDVPADIGVMRQRLFQLAEPVVLSQADWEIYWPFVDNVYAYRDKRPEKKDGSQLSYWQCRLHRKSWQGSRHAGVRQRHKGSRQGSVCNFVVHVTRRLGGSYEIRRAPKHSNTHSHSLDESDAVKINSALRRQCQEQVTKGVNPAHIVTVLQGAERSSRATLEHAGGKYIDRQIVVNTAQGWRRSNPDKRFVGADNSWQEQVSDAKEWLEKTGYMVHQADCLQPPVKDKPAKRSNGLIFALPRCLDVLRRRGYLTLMDATHDMNGLRWYLFTAMVRDEINCWHPSAHMLCDAQDSNIISRFLLKLKHWCYWQPRYFLTDDSAAEQLAVKKAFPGFGVDDFEVTHLLCRVHSMRSLDRALKTQKAARNHLIAALKYRKTSLGCDDSIERAFQAATNEKTRRYIKKEWQNTKALWANYARTHSCLLLQV